MPGGRQFSRSLVWDSQYTFGGTLSRYDEQRQAVLPIIMHPQPRSVAFLGLATGITAGTALDLPGVEHVTAIELSPQVVRCVAVTSRISIAVFVMTRGPPWWWRMRVHVPGGLHA